MPENHIKTTARQRELVNLYLEALQRHLEDLRHGRAENALEIRDFAEMLHVHQRHLSSTIREVTGKSPCDFFEQGLMEIARELLGDRSHSIAWVAKTLTFDPSNFTKFFKRFAGITPGQYRERIFAMEDAAKTPNFVQG